MTLRELATRWKSPAGKVAARSIEEALRAGTTVGELRGYAAGLPGASNVAPAADLRGIALPGLLSVHKANLSGARFDGARLSWNFGGSTLRGAVFDRAEGRNVDFGGSDLTSASFVGANLPGAVFFGARLTDARLPGIKMRSGQLKNADCSRADFSGADLRLVWAADADLRGADLSGANLVGASLGRAAWDENTRFAAARLSFEGTPAEICAHALGQGATVTSEKPDRALSLLDATCAAMESANRSEKRVATVRRIRELRPAVERDPGYGWVTALHGKLDPGEWSELQATLRKAASNIGAYLG